MIKVFKLPDLGEGLTESEIVAWHIAPGDTVELNQHIADVETAKAVVELPSPFAGIVTELHQQPGVVVHVGEPIVSFETDAAGGADSAEISPAAAAGQREAVLVGYGAAAERGGRPARRPRVGAPAVEPAETVTPVVEPVETTSSVVEPVGTTQRERPRSTPPVRALARELGVDLTLIEGTGPDGLITREDVRVNAAEGVAGRAAASAGQGQGQGQGPPPAPTGPADAKTDAATSARETRAPIKGLRKLTAAAMVQSAFTAPHATEFLTVDVTPTLELLDALKRDRAFADHRIGILTVVAKALCIAVARNPSVNTRWDDAAGEIVQFHYVNLGIAAATPRGLIVPNLKDAQALSLTELASALAALTDAARAGTTGQEALSGGTISITNIGVFGIDAGTPILNPGEAAILAMGSIRRTPWEHRGEIALRSVMTLSLSFDHRLVDGEQGSRFLADIGSILANPGMVLTMV